MQFKSKKYVKAVESYAASALKTNGLVAVLCVETVNASSSDLSGIVTDTMMLTQKVLLGIIADVKSRKATISRSTIRNVWKMVVAKHSTVHEDGSVTYDEAAMLKIAEGIKTGKIAVVSENQDKAPSKKPTKKDHVFTFIDNHAKPMTKAQSVKAIKRIMAACGLSLADLK